jgi:hypothetical protein
MQSFIRVEESSTVPEDNRKFATAVAIFANSFRCDLQKDKNFLRWYETSGLISGVRTHFC